MLTAAWQMHKALGALLKNHMWWNTYQHRFKSTDTVLPHEESALHKGTYRLHTSYRVSYALSGLCMLHWRVIPATHPILWSTTMGQLNAPISTCCNDLSFMLTISNLQQMLWWWGSWWLEYDAIQLKWYHFVKTMLTENKVKAACSFMYIHMELRQHNARPEIIGRHLLLVKEDLIGSNQ